MRGLTADPADRLRGLPVALDAIDADKPFRSETARISKARRDRRVLLPTELQDDFTLTREEFYRLRGVGA